MRPFSKSVIVISSLFFLFSCSKESVDNPVDIQFVFDAVSTVSEQTVEEAKKTIIGSCLKETIASFFLFCLGYPS